MQISNLYKKRIVSAVVLIVMLSGLGYFVGELIRPCHYSTDIYNAEYKTMKDSKTNVDMVFIGASRVLVGFDPKVFEEKLSLHKVYNLSVSQLGMEEMYYQLEEFLEEFHPKTVVLGITYGGLIQKNTPKILKLRMLERLHGSNFLAYIKDSLSIDEYPDILPVYGYRGYLSGIKQNIKNIQQFKTEGIYMKTDKWQSMGQGFVAYPKSVPSGNMGIRKTQGFDRSMVLKNTIHYLDKCIQLCKEKNVRVFLMTPPTSMANIYETGNFQGIIDYIDEYARKNNVVYHNLNYLKNKEEFLPDSMMYDFKHINKKGSKIISEKYAEILSLSFKNKDTDDYFYSSLSEMKNSVKRIVAVDAKPVIKNNIMTLPIQSLQNNDVIPSYQLLMAKDNKKFNPVMNWTGKKNVSFAVPKGSEFRILLRARQNEKDTNYAWMAWEIDKKRKIRKLQNVSLKGI